VEKDSILRPRIMFGGKGVLEGEEQRVVAQRIKAEMQQLNLWKEALTKKNPGKYHDYQRTLEVLKFLRDGSA
jgi:hypothetical protein